MAGSAVGEALLPSTWKESFGDPWREGTLSEARGFAVVHGGKERVKSAG